MEECGVWKNRKGVAELVEGVYIRVLARAKIATSPRAFRNQHLATWDGRCTSATRDETTAVACLQLSGSKATDQRQPACGSLEGDPSKDETG